jgi:predicted anti-sigma-YlaC factor YlaD
MLHSYINGELNQLECASVQAHLASCNDCSKEILEIKKLKSIIKQTKLESIKLDELKYNIMTAIKTTQKAAASYDARVIWRLGTSLIACGLMVMVLNFTSFGSEAKLHMDKMNIEIQAIEEKITQPIAFINKGLAEMSSGIMNLDGITFRIQQRIRGGM